MKKPVKIIGGIILAVLVACGVAAMMLAPAAVEAVTLETVTARVTFTELGSYVYNRSMAVYPQIAGEVLEIKAKPGASVSKGDVLAVVSASDYEYQIKTLESTVAGYQAQIGNLHTQEAENKNTLYSSRESLVGQIAQIDASMKDVKKSEKTLERQLSIQEDIMAQNQNLVNLLREDYSEAKQLYNGGAIDQSQYNAIREAYSQAHTALDASRQQYEDMKKGVAGIGSYEEQRSSLEAQLKLVDSRLGQDNTRAMQQYYNAMIEGTKSNIESMNEKLGQASIVAPMDGVIDELPVRDANVISPAALAATICAEPVVEVFVPIREIDGVKLGDKAELIIDKRLGGESVYGTVTLIENEATTKISALGVEESKVRVLIEPDDNDFHIGYGMDVKFTVFEQENTVIIPKTAVFEKDGKDMVWVIENGAAAFRQIEKGVETREGYAVNSGLSSGEVVITDANTDGLKEGKRVKPV